MYLLLLINGKETFEYYCHTHQEWNVFGEDYDCCSMYEDGYYCPKHDKWNWAGDEGNCCAIEEEEALIQAERSQLG